MRIVKAVAIAAVSAGALSVCVVLPTAAAPWSLTASAQAGPGGTIAFEGSDGLYLTDAAGGEPRRIAGTLPRDGDPAWSPDGLRIVFDRGGDDRDIWVMDADGSNQRRLTFAPGDDGWPRWAPHGRAIVFESDRDGGSTAAYVVDLRRGQSRRVARNAGYPDWRPDGRITFQNDRSFDVESVRPYGRGRRVEATENDVGRWAIRVSPDGARMVFTDGGNRPLLGLRLSQHPFLQEQSSSFARIYWGGGAEGDVAVGPGYPQPTSIGQDGTALVSDRRLRVGLVTEPAGIDNPYNHGAYLGLERAVRELGIRGRVLTPAPKEGYVPSLSLLARQKYDLVIGTGGYAAPAIDRVAIGFPETRFAIIDVAHDDLAHRPKNVLGLAFSEEQAGYLVGHLAALVLTLSPGEEVVSSVGGERVSTVERFIAGYQAGARGANPRVTTLNSYTDSFLDPVKGRSVALSQIAKGSRVVFQVANVCGLGALEAASERGIWGIGVDVDQSHLGRHILTSALKRFDVAVFDTIEALARGTLDTGCTSRFSLENRGVGLGAVSAAVPRSLKAEIEDIRAEIVAGRIPIASSVT